MSLESRTSETTVVAPKALEGAREKELLKLFEACAEAFVELQQAAANELDDIGPTP